MTLLSSRIVTSKSYEEAYQIIKSFAYHLPKGQFLKETFSLCSAKRFNRGIISLIPIKGEIIQNASTVEITVSICADLGFWLGGLLSLTGLIISLLCIIFHSARWIPGVGSILLGMLIIGQSFWEGKALIDRLDHMLNS